MVFVSSSRNRPSIHHYHMAVVCSVDWDFFHASVSLKTHLYRKFVVSCDFLSELLSFRFAIICFKNIFKTFVFFASETVARFPASMMTSSTFLLLYKRDFTFQNLFFFCSSLFNLLMAPFKTTTSNSLF